MAARVRPQRLAAPTAIEAAVAPSLGIERQTLAGRVAERLRDLIAEDVLQPGEKLNEQRLAEKLHVSRTPLREGIKLLASEGLVDLVPNRGAYVANPDAREVEDMLTALGAVEAAAAELACHVASDAKIAELRQKHALMLKAYRRRDRLEYFKLNQQIHLGIAGACGNATLQRLHQTLNARLYRARFLSTSSALWGEERWSSAIADHEAIMGALERREPAVLARVLKAHLGQTWKALETSTVRRTATVPARKKA